MPIPIQLDRPVKRPPGQMILGASWVGPDDDLSLEVTYLDQSGVPDVISFPTANSNENRVGSICMRSDAAPGNIERDTIAAHLRMGSFLAGALIGSFEWDNMWLEQNGARDVQLACGTAVVSSIRFTTDTAVEIDLKMKGNNHAPYTFTIGVDELTNYSFVPSTQLRVIAGAVKAAFPNYVHDFPNDSLSPAQRQDVIDYVTGLQIWV